MNRPYAILGATLIDGTGAEPLADAAVVVDGGRITAVGPIAGVPVPPSAERIDAAGRFLLPGLIDLHVHVFTSGFVPIPPKGSELAYAGVVAAANLRAALDAGTTTIRDVSSGHVGLALRTAIERGLTPGPRCFVCGRGICMTGGHGSQGAGMGVGVHEVDGVTAVRAAIRAERKAGADLIKILTSHRSEYPEFTPAELDAAVDEAHRLGMTIAVHAGNFATTRMAAEAGFDTIEHGIEIDEETAEQMAEKGITLVPTLWVLHDIFEETARRKARYESIGEYERQPDHDWMEETLRVYRQILAALPKTMEIVRRHGVQIAAGTDNVRATVPFAMIAHEIEHLTRYGLAPMEAIVAATRNGARALRQEERLGTVEPGKLADLILVDRNPLEEITALRAPSWVMRGGRPHPIAAPGTGGSLPRGGHLL